MIKKIFILITLVLIMVYLVFAIAQLSNKPENQVCKEVDLLIKDSIDNNLLSKTEVVALLKQKGQYPKGKKMQEIKTKYMERELGKHPLIESAECYKTPSGKIRMEIKQRLPILRIMTDTGESYFVDNKGKIVPPEANCIAHLVIVTGSVEKAFAMGDLYNFGVFLQKNKFWEAQIEQINVTPNKEIELIPRVGDHIIFLGKIEDFEPKLERLKTFYEKVLNIVGWNKYSRISLEFNNQIICTKKNN